MSRFRIREHAPRSAPHVEWLNAPGSVERKARLKCVSDCERMFALKGEHGAVERYKNGMPKFRDRASKKSFAGCQKTCNGAYR